MPPNSRRRGSRCVVDERAFSGQPASRRREDHVARRGYEGAVVAEPNCRGLMACHQTATNRLRTPKIDGVWPEPRPRRCTVGNRFRFSEVIVMDARQRRNARPKTPDTTPIWGRPRAVSDRDVDVLAWQFLHSEYAGHEYAGWPLHRRLEGFLRRRGLGRLADSGDVCNSIVDRIMTHISAALRQRGRRGPQQGGRTSSTA